MIKLIISVTLSGLHRIHVSILTKQFDYDMMLKSDQLTRLADFSYIDFFIYLVCSFFPLKQRIFTCTKCLYAHMIFQFLTKNGIYDFWNWFDDRTW